MLLVAEACEVVFYGPYVSFVTLFLSALFVVVVTIGVMLWFFFIRRGE